MSTLPRRRGSKSKYCEGWINIQISDQQAQYKKYYCQLRDRDICIFDNDLASRNPSNVKEKINLESVHSVIKDKKRENVFPTISIMFKSTLGVPREVRIRALTANEQEKWFRFLYANALFKFPQDTIELLPGQRHELSDMIQIEQQKIEDRQKQDTIGYIHMKPAPLSPNNVGGGFPPTSFPVSKGAVPRRHSTPTPPLAGPKPPAMLPQHPTAAAPQIPSPTSPTMRKCWYFDEIMSRERAEDILTRNAEFGNLIMRKREDTADNYAYAISVKLGANEFKHYRVKKETGPAGSNFTYVIFLSNKSPPPLRTIDDVINYVMAECPGTLVPLTDVKPALNNDYEVTLPTGRRGNGWTRPHNSVSQSFNTELDSPRSTYLNETDINSPEYHNLTNDVQRGIGKLQASLTRMNTSPAIPAKDPTVGYINNHRDYK